MHRVGVVKELQQLSSERVLEFQISLSDVHLQDESSDQGFDNEVGWFERVNDYGIDAIRDIDADRTADDRLLGDARV
jgi:hypothetical protein